MSLTCAIMISTRNRLRDLQRTLGVIAQLAPQPDEILVCADGCTDGTVEFLKTQPQVRPTVNEQARGSVASRDAMMRQTSCDIVLGFDDDSEPIETDYVQKARDLFEKNPKLAIATFPERSNEYPESLTQKDFGTPYFTGTFGSGRAAIRRSVFVEVGGYPGFFHHTYEEPDLALRCVAAGWEVKYEPSLLVRHLYTSAGRNELRVHYFQARNELWSVVLRCPAPWCFGVGLFRALRQAGYARKRGLSWLVREPSWWMGFFAGLPQCLTQRKPVPWKQYRRWMELIRKPIFSQAEYDAGIESRSTS